MDFSKDFFSKHYKITFEYRPEYLYVYVSGDRDSYEISRQYWQEIADKCSADKCKRVLIEEDIAEQVSMADAFKVASEIPQMGFFGIRLAFVDRYLAHQEINEFGELVAVNRGLYGKVFNDFTEAEKWLLAE